MCIENKNTDVANNSEFLKKSDTAMLIIVGINLFGGLMFLILPAIISITLIGIINISTIGIIFDDYQMWKNAGIQMCTRWWSLLFPVYLWKRANILGIPKKIFWIWLGSTIALWFISTIIFLILFINGHYRYY